MASYATPAKLREIEGIGEAKRKYGAAVQEIVASSGEPPALSAAGAREGTAGTEPVPPGGPRMGG
jgi:hypothetical protein